MEQLSNTEAVAQCKAVTGLQLEIRRRSTASIASSAGDAAEGGGEEGQPAEGTPTAAESETPADPNKRQRKAPTSLLSELEDEKESSRSKARAKEKGKGDGKKDKDPHAPKPAQSAFMYFSKQALHAVTCRDLPLQEGGAFMYLSNQWYLLLRAFTCCYLPLRRRGSTCRPRVRRRFPSPRSAGNGR